MYEQLYLVLYAASIRTEFTILKSYDVKLKSVYRLAAHRIRCSYRVVSDESAFVIAAMIPIGILAREAVSLTKTRLQSI